MRFVIPLLVIAAVLALTPTAMAQTCRLNAIEPDSGKAGDVVTTTGEQIDNSKVAELYLTDGTNDTKVEIVSQSEKEIKFKIPAKAKAGRYSLMLKTKGPDAKLLEQPVKLSVEE